MKLEPFDESDVDRLLAWLGTDERFLVQWSARSFHHPIDRDQLIQHLRSLGEDRVAFRVVDPARGEVIGHAEIGRIDRESGSGRVGRMLVGDPAARGKGAGTAILEAVVAEAFGRLALRRLTLGVYDFNTRAIRCYERVGFVHGPSTPDAVRVDGKSWTLIDMALERGESAPAPGRRARGSG